jgi:hypothetical protein
MSVVMSAFRDAIERVDVVPFVDLSKRTLACNKRMSGCARGHVLMEGSHQSCPASHTTPPGPDGGPPAFGTVSDLE